jgi:hypothetical protein
MLNWVDFLVIMATVIVFGAVVAANNPHAARAQTRADSTLIRDLPQQSGASEVSPDLIKAKMRLTAGGPWL